jgi:hypothetical protein
MIVVRLTLVAWLSGVQPILDHVRKPFGLLNDLFQEDTDGPGQARLRQRRPCQNQHTRDWLPHVVTCFAQPLSGVRCSLGVGT